jgi:aryl-alcohol dehydrogenase-like predicted oxidoreductase
MGALNDVVQSGQVRYIGASSVCIISHSSLLWVSFLII